MTIEIQDVVGSIGVTMMLLVFFLNIADKLHNDHPFYICMNMLGGTLACTASIMISYWPFIILEATWTSISIWALIVFFKRDYKKFMKGEKYGKDA
jgi:hypothetical protein